MIGGAVDVGGVSAHDIVDQPTGWQAALDAVEQNAAVVRQRWTRKRPAHIVITGCGSPFFLASAVAHLLADSGAVGVPITLATADELRRLPATVAPSPASTLLVAISRSGATTEVINAIDRFRAEGGADVWGLTCRSNSPIVERADLAITVDAGFESGVAQTRSFSSMLVAAQAIAAVLGGHDLADAADLAAIGRRCIDIARSNVDQLDLGAHTNRIDFVGSLTNYGLAREAMLKMSEMALTSSAAYHVLEYRHGPIAMTDEHSLLVGLLSPTDTSSELLVLDDVVQLGGRTVAIDASWLPSDSTALPTWARPVLQMPALQMIAHRRAVVMGLDPDHPRHLKAVVHLDGDDTTRSDN